MNKIVWLASYPKSGNTWCRIFLENLKLSSENVASINKLSIKPEARRQLIEEITGIDTTLLHNTEIECLMPEVYKYWSDHAENLEYFKTHNLYYLLPDNTPFIPEYASFGAIYIVRNPLDIVVSFAHHANESIENTIKKLNDQNYTVGNQKDKHTFLLPQKLSSWNKHVESWVDNTNLKTLIIRYEDMKLYPLETFRKIAKFTKLYTNELSLKKAIENSSFKMVKKQELMKGFREKRPGSKSFFRKGEIGSWKEKISEKQVQQIIADHGRIMYRLGYLNESGEVLY